MSKIKNAFTNKEGKAEKAFIAFITAGDPTLEKTAEFILAMEKAGAGLIELGIPFSDPTAEGPVIQDANIRALNNGMTTENVFESVEIVRETSLIPIVLLTYLNPVFKYGYDAFFARCASSGVDGVIIPDIPYEEKGEILPFAKKYAIDLISLVAPTSEERIQMIAKEADGFIYVVSSMGVTGLRSEIKTDVKSIIDSIRTVSDLPCAVGFGINTPEQAKALSEVADGIIVGSALVKIIEKHGENAAQPLYEYVKMMKSNEAVV
jgi:tryptophan synthase, alpha subunit